MKKIAQQILLVIALFGICEAVVAQSVVQATTVTLQPQIGRDDGGYSTCGVHVIALDVQQAIIDVYDFSINIHADMFSGLAKAGKMQVLPKDMLAGKTPNKAVQPAPVMFWISKESDGSSLRPREIIAAETPGYILASTELVKTYEILLAIINGERMQFSTRYKNQGMDTVVSFGSALPEAQLSPLMACIEGITERFKLKAEETDEKSD